MELYALSVQMSLLAVLVAPLSASTTTERVRFCGGSLSQALSMVCRSFNSPLWDQSGFRTRNRVKRDYGIADECCTDGCTWNDLRLYCADDEPAFPSPELAASSVSDEMGHIIADRSAEAAAEEPAAVPAGFRGLFGRSEVGNRARDGAGGAGAGARYGRGERRRRRGRGGCWCRRRRRAGRRRATGINNMMNHRGASRSAPVLGTVSPLLMWGRTLHTDLPARERLLYVTV